MIEYSQVKAPTLPKSTDDKVRQLQSDIEQLKQADGNQYREQLKAADMGLCCCLGIMWSWLLKGWRYDVVIYYPFL